MACGGALDHLNATVGLLQQTGALNDLGLGIAPPGIAVGALGDSHPAVLSDDEHSAQIGRLVVAILFRRLPSMAFHMLSYPGASQTPRVALRFSSSCSQTCRRSEPCVSRHLPSGSGCGQGPLSLRSGCSKRRGLSVPSSGGKEL